MALVNLGRGTQQSYNAIANKSQDKLFFCTDTGNIYLGDVCLFEPNASITATLVGKSIVFTTHGSHGETGSQTLDLGAFSTAEEVGLAIAEAVNGITWNSVGAKPPLSLNNGLRVYLNGVDVTNIANVQPLDAARQWFGSASQYAKLVHDNLVENDVAYYLQPNPDWDETDEESLSYIKNKPKILDVTTEDTNANNKKMILFYK